MRALAGIVLSIFAYSSQPAEAAQTSLVQILLPDRLGAVRLGMSVAQAERALGARLTAETDRREPCWYASRADGRGRGIAYMVERGRVVRIDVLVGRDAIVPAVATGRGISIGSTLDEVLQAYGTGTPVEPHPLAPDARWMVVERTSRGGIRLHLGNGRVSSLWAGRGRALDYPEGCS